MAKRKAIACLLVCAMILTLFAGCGSSQTGAVTNALETVANAGYSGTQESLTASLAGETGIQGQKSDVGKSAYELAVERGYSGRSEEHRVKRISPTSSSVRNRAGGWCPAR